jgi:hypothetical protein
VASLTGLFKSVAGETGDSEKLLDLYWNRAELKKEFAALRNEKYQLQDRIKQHEGSTARVQQKMDHLESLLQDPEWVHNVVVFYQLRRLDIHCNVTLERFAEQLKQQREQRLHNRVLVSWNEKCSEEADLIESQIGEQRMQVQLLEDQLQAERHKLMTMNIFAKLLRGRRLATDIDELLARIEIGQQQEHEMLLALDNLQDQAPPDYTGLGIAEKRSINFMILSFAQHLYLHFVEDNLVAMAKEATEKSVGAINYGSKHECDILTELLEKRWNSMEKATSYTEILQKRAQMIAEHASFDGEDNAVPAATSVETTYSIDDNGVVREIDVNLMRENYFGIAKVLSR